MTYSGEQVVDLLAVDTEIVTHALDRWAALDGGKQFILDGNSGDRLSFGEVSVSTDTIAAALAARGVTKGQKVSMFLRDPLPQVLWMLAIWKAGAVFCPVNYAYRAELLTYQLDDTQPSVVLTEPSMYGPLMEALHKAAVRPLVVVTGEPDGVEALGPAVEGVWVLPEAAFRGDHRAPAVEVRYDDPACVIYTSGTTGPAKGVVVSHRWIAQYTWVVRRLTTPDDVIYNDLPLYHVGGALWNVARAAWCGAGVALWDKFSASRFWARIEQSGATAATLMDVMSPWLMSAAPDDEDRSNSLRLVTMQPLPADHQDMSRRFGIDFVLSGFGQTESGHVMAAVIEELPQDQGTPPELYRGLSHEQVRERAETAGLCFIRGDEVPGKGFMGAPTPYYETLVVDENDRPCPPGTAGQLVLRPKAPSILTSGYLGKPDATVETWRNLWFHTGDAVVRDEDGFWFFVDRMGTRIRRRGENITAYFVEELMRKHPEVEMAAAFGVPSLEGDEDDIVVCVTAVEGRDISGEAVRAWSDEELPKFMRPQHVLVVAEIPTTPTGKIQKFKLRAKFLEQDRPQPDEKERAHG
jgi:crotonobetaine/carnitine-CoA ligase